MTPEEFKKKSEEFKKKSEEFKKKLKLHLDTADSIKNLLQNNSDLSHEEFVAQVMSTIMSKPKSDLSIMMQCDFNSIIQCCIKAAQLKLSIDVNGYVYLIPRKNKDKVTFECTFQIGVKGYIALAKTNKEVLQITSNSVYEDDEFDYWQDEGGFHYKHKPKLNGKYNRENIQGLVCVYATIKYTNGGSETQLMDTKTIGKIKHCASTDKIWAQWHTEKAITACIKRLLKRQACLKNVQDALEKDDDKSDDDKETKNIETKINSTEIKTDPLTGEVIKNKFPDVDGFNAPQVSIIKEEEEEQTENELFNELNGKVEKADNEEYIEILLVEVKEADITKEAKEGLQKTLNAKKSILECENEEALLTSWKAMDGEMHKKVMTLKDSQKAKFSTETAPVKKETQELV